MEMAVCPSISSLQRIMQSIERHIRRNQNVADNRCFTAKLRILLKDAKILLRKIVYKPGLQQQYSRDRLKLFNHRLTLL